MANTTNLGLPLMAAAQSQKHITHNDAILSLDAVVQLSVKSTSLTAPPGSPAEGDRYLIGSGATGAWDDKDLNITYYTSGAWVFLVPRKGWMCWDEANGAMLVWNGTSWTNLMTAMGSVTSTTLNNNSLAGKLTMLGLGGATADTTNRLSANTPSVLFNRETDDINVTLNKAAAGDDARLTFQDGFSTRALFGLLGNDDFSVSVSPDGSTFYSAMAIDKDTGNVAIGAGSDANNRLLVSGENNLFTSSGSLRFTFNKGSSSDDAALTFQSGFSARALIGLLGDENFTFKVTPDGSSFFTSFVLDKSTGNVSYEALLGAKRTFPNIASNTLTVASSYVNIGNAGTINNFAGGYDGAIVIVQNTSGGTVTISNSGNIKTPGATSMTLDSWNDAAIFVCNGGGTWLCVGFSNNG